MKTRLQLIVGIETNEISLTGSGGTATHYFMSWYLEAKHGERLLKRVLLPGFLDPPKVAKLLFNFGTGIAERWKVSFYDEGMTEAEIRGELLSKATLCQEAWEEKMVFNWITEIGLELASS